MIGIIDIGSNSIRLMLSEADKTLSKSVVTARLGEGLALTGVLKTERMKIATNFIKAYVDEAIAKGASKVFVFATEAVRAASNRDIFLDMVYNATGIHIDVVPNIVEAKLGFSGAYIGHGTIAVVDIGGASTEITVGDENGIRYSKSLPIGVVRMRDKCGENDDLLDEYIDEMLVEYGEIERVEKAIFVAGTASTVATMHLQMDEYKVELLDNMYIDNVELTRLMDVIKSTPLKERNAIHGLPCDRADIMYGGMRLIRAILAKLDLDGFFFSDRDNLEGYRKYLVETHQITR